MPVKENSPYRESDLLIDPKNQARRKLKRAIEGITETAHLPPGCDERDAAIEQLRWAKALAAEMEI
jgi:hypothetical protein